MITRLRGVLVEKDLDRVVVEVGGVGYLVSIPLQTLQTLPQKGQEVLLYTYLQVREDAFLLYGFASLEEREIFERCISVSGIGPKLALTLLSGFEVPQLIDTLQRGDIGQLSKLPGIGKKTAERLVLELRDKLGPRRLSSAAQVGGLVSSGGVSGDVVTALCNLGYRPADAEKAASLALKEQPDASIAEILRTALRSLQRG